MTKHEFSECSCHCHTNKNIRHVAPCCDECSICSKRVKLWAYGAHLALCEKDSMDLLAQFTKAKFGRDPNEYEIAQWKGVRGIR